MAKKINFTPELLGYIRDIYGDADLSNDTLKNIYQTYQSNPEHVRNAAQQKRRETLSRAPLTMPEKPYSLSPSQQPTRLNPVATREKDDLRQMNSFNDAFGEARKRGLTNFRWGNQTYGTQLAPQVPRSYGIYGSRINSPQTPDRPNTGAQDANVTVNPGRRPQQVTTDTTQRSSSEVPSWLQFEAPVSRPWDYNRNYWTGEQRTAPTSSATKAQPVTTRNTPTLKSTPRTITQTPEVRQVAQDSQSAASRFATPGYTGRSRNIFTEVAERTAPFTNAMNKGLGLSKRVGTATNQQETINPPQTTPQNTPQPRRSVVDRVRGATQEIISGQNERSVREAEQKRRRQDWIMGRKKGGTIEPSNKKVQEFAGYLMTISGAKDENELQDFITNQGTSNINKIYQNWEGSQDKIDIMSAKQGSKLNYLIQLRGKCPEGYEMTKFEKGGVVCNVCKKSTSSAAQLGAKGTKFMKSFKNEITEKKKAVSKQKGGTTPKVAVNQNDTIHTAKGPQVISGKKNTGYPQMTKKDYQNLNTTDKIKVENKLQASGSNPTYPKKKAKGGGIGKLGKDNSVGGSDWAGSVTKKTPKKTASQTGSWKQKYGTAFQAMGGTVTEGPIKPKLVKKNKKK